MRRPVVSIERVKLSVVNMAKILSTYWVNFVCLVFTNRGMSNV